jgi:hypothetical protein
MAGRLWLKSTDGLAAWKIAGSVALHWGLLDWGVLFSEAL